MVCMTHGWWFDTPCERCQDGKVDSDLLHVDTVAVREQEAADVDRIAHDPAAIAALAYSLREYVEPPLPAGQEDDWTVPPFLRRRLDGGYTYPSLHPGTPNAFVAGLGWVETTRGTVDLSSLPDRDLLTALSDGAISCEGRQPIILEARRREERLKARRTKPMKEKAIASIQ